jgi:hypothetical protein
MRVEYGSLTGSKQVIVIQNKKVEMVDKGRGCTIKSGSLGRYEIGGGLDLSKC